VVAFGTAIPSTRLEADLFIEAATIVSFSSFFIKHALFFILTAVNYILRVLKI
jgi:hypothetical protein